MMSKRNGNKEGYKHTSLGWIPEGWESAHLENFCVKITDGTHDTPVVVEKGVPYITAVHVKDGNIDFNNCYYVNEKDHNEIYKRCNPERGDVLMVNIGAGVASTALINVDFEFSLKNVALIKPNKNKIDSKYLESFQLFIKPKLLQELLNGGAQPFLGLKDIKRLPFYCPPLHEQQEIASILSIWDNAIIKTRQLIAQLQQRNKGLMQELLTAKKTWKEYRMGDLLKEVTRPVKWDDEELYHLISVRRRSGGAFFRESLYGKQILTKQLFTVEEGDFLISKMQIVHGASAVVPPELAGMKISGSYIAVHAKEEKVMDINFFNWLSKTRWFYRLTYVSSYGVHIEKMTFDFDDFKRRKIRLPSTIEEQRKIVTILQTAFDEVKLHEQKFYFFQQQKKGIMQKLLTGETRVKI